MPFFDKVPFEVLALIVLCYVQVPFRLTRMMVKAMEVSGVEGNFRSAPTDNSVITLNPKKKIVVLSSHL